MNHDRRHDVPRTLATRNSRRHALTLLTVLLAVGLLAAVGLGSAQTTVGEDPLTTTGLTVSELEEFMRDPPNQAVCAQLVPPFESCFLGLCSVECPESSFGLAACFPPAGSEGNPLCGAVEVCNEVAGCSSNADCGPRQFCAVTCCPIVNQCITRCPEDNP